MNRIISALVIIACLLAGRTADAFSFVAKFNSTYTYTNTNVRMSLNQASINMATSVANGVSLSVITAAGTTNNFYSTTSTIFSLTLWPPNGVSTSIYLYAGDKLRATSSATNDCWLTVLYSGLDVERIHGTANVIANTVGAESMDTNSIPTYAIQSSAVTQSKLATNSVNGSANVTDYSITGTDMETGTVGAAQIASTAVTNGTYTNALITVDADGRITYAASVPFSAIGTQALASVLGIGNDAGGAGITNGGTSVFQRVHAAYSGTNIDNATIGITKVDTNYLKMLRLVGVFTDSGSAAGVGAGGARVMIVSTTQLARSSYLNMWGFLAATNAAAANFAVDLGVTAEVSSNGTSWIQADKANGTQGAVTSLGWSTPWQLHWFVPAGMYYQVYCNAGSVLTLHQGWTTSWQRVRSESD